MCIDDNYIKKYRIVEHIMYIQDKNQSYAD